MLKVEQAYVIRHKVLVEGKSRRQVAREMGVSRNTVRKYVEAQDPEPKRVEGPRAQPVRERAEKAIDDLLEDWKGRTAGKHRITGTRVHEALLESGVKVGATVVREVLAERRRQAAEASIPLVHRPGEEAQVDFFEVLVDEDGVRRKAWKFVMRLMYSGRDFVWLYDRADQLAFFDGHVRAFAYFDAVPQRIVYDNLKAAVKRLLRRGRELNGRFLALVNHYLFEPCFARPYHGDDKGGVEARGGAIRRQHLTPILQGPTLEAMASEVLARVEQEAANKARTPGRSVLECFAEERPRMLPLPARPYRVERVVPVSLTRSALARVEGAVYSVPCAWKMLRATAHVGLHSVRIVCRDEEVEHPRQPFGGRSVRQRHYLPEFAKKPQAVRQNAAELLAELGEPNAGSGASWSTPTGRATPRASWPGSLEPSSSTARSPSRGWWRTRCAATSSTCSSSPA